MKLWLLDPISDDDCSWDCARGFVIRAKTEDEARKIAESHHGDESDYEEFWTNPAKSTCKILSNKGKMELILRDFKSA